MQNHFDLFQLPQQFAVDLKALDFAYREVQMKVHPDKFVNASNAEKRVAMQWATRANEAYQTLKSPFGRARYLCELNGIDLQTESNTVMPVEFLMQQMEWREALQDARRCRDAGMLEALAETLRTTRKAKVESVAQHLDARDFALAAQEVRQMMFLEKFDEEVEFALETMN